MTSLTLDHVALFVADPERAAARLRARLPLRVLERTDDFVLLGRAPELGKLTLFQAPGPRERGRLARLALGVPCAAERTTVQVEEGFAVELVPADPEGEVDLHTVELAVPDPHASARRWQELGFAPDGATDGWARLRAGRALLELRAVDVAEPERPLLNHLGLRVDSLEDARRLAREAGLHVEREVDAPSSLAFFVRGPDGVQVEYIEHKPSFALA